MQVYWLDVSRSEEPQQYRSLVIQVTSSETIFVLTGKDANTYLAAVDRFEDTWDASMPEKPAACAALPPPEGYLLPVEGIGKIWCEQSLWLSIGWPKEAAQAAAVTIQPAWNGLLIEAKTAMGAYLVAIDAHAGLATVQEVP